jgi:hypothetical protein
MKKSLLKIILKTKDEEFLLETWIEYYSKIVGVENIIIFDDNSTSEKAINIYKKYNLQIFKRPDYFNSFEEFHHKSKNLDVFKQIEDSCEFFAIFDSDEFLCFFDFEKKCIDNTKLLHFIKDNINRLAFPTTWIYNLYSTDLDSPKDVVNFSFDLNQSSFTEGKIIIKSNLEVENIHHNRLCQYKKDKFPLKACPELFLLHLNNVNLDNRHKSNINHAKNTLKNKKIYFKNEEDLFRILCCAEKDFDLRCWEAKSYFLDQEAFKKRKRFVAKQTLKTNIINTDLSEYETSFINEPIDIKKYMLDIFYSIEWPKMAINVN